MLIFNLYEKILIIAPTFFQCFNFDCCHLASSSLSDCTNLEKKNELLILRDIWGKVFKNGPNKISGRQPLKNLKKSVFHKFYWFIFWILCPIYFISFWFVFPFLLKEIARSWNRDISFLDLKIFILKKTNFWNLLMFHTFFIIIRSKRSISIINSEL